MKLKVIGAIALVSALIFGGVGVNHVYGGTTKTFSRKYKSSDNHSILG